MRRSPRRPLILKRRKLPFQQNEPAPAETSVHSCPPNSKEPSKPSAGPCSLDGIRVLDHPSMSDTQVVVIPKEVNLQSVIGALTAKGKESGVQGPNKFILLSENGSNGSFCQASVPSRSAAEPPVNTETVLNSSDAKPHSGIKSKIANTSCGPLDDSLTNIQWLGKMSMCALEPESQKQMTDKENLTSASEDVQTYGSCTRAEGVQQPVAERPPFSYMAMIQFAINSRQDRRMTLKEIYMWIEDHFPYYREVAKPGWKNSIRHNLSLHDMFVRETSPDGKISFWTIRPEIIRRLTLDQIYKPCCDPATAAVPVSVLSCPHQRIGPAMKKSPASSERRMKPLLPRTEPYLVPIQLPVATSLYLPPTSASFGSSFSKQKSNSSQGAKRVRIAPKVAQSNTPVMAKSPPKSNNLKVEIKEESVSLPVTCETSKAPPKRQASSSRRKQRLVNSLDEEPVLLSLDNTYFDSGVVSDASSYQDNRDVEIKEHRHGQDSPDREFTFKTPIKSSNHLTSSTPSKSPPNVGLELWKVTPVRKESQNVLDFSPIHTPGGPAVTPRPDYTPCSLSSTPFKDVPLFNSPRELFTFAASRVSGPPESPIEQPQSSCSRELLQGGAATPANLSVTEGLVLDIMNESLSKILVDISFTGLDEDLSTANMSWSEFIGQI